MRYPHFLLAMLWFAITINGFELHRPIYGSFAAICCAGHLICWIIDRTQPPTNTSKEGAE